MFLMVSKIHPVLVVVSDLTLRQCRRITKPSVCNKLKTGRLHPDLFRLDLIIFGETAKLLG